MRFFYVSALFGVAQIAFTALLLIMSTTGRKKNFFWLCVLKCLLYVGAAVLLVFKLKTEYMYLITGYLLGAALSATALLLYSVFRKEENK